MNQPFLCVAFTTATTDPSFASSGRSVQYRGSEKCSGPIAPPESNRVAVKEY